MLHTQNIQPHLYNHTIHPSFYKAIVSIHTYSYDLIYIKTFMWDGIFFYRKLYHS
jgi:hypothetical protein